MTCEVLCSLVLAAIVLPEDPTDVERSAADELREARLQAAARLLEDTETPLGEIAARIGFGNGGSLMNAFRRRYGCSMREWRRKNR